MTDKEMEFEASFAELFEASLKRPGKEFRPGDTVSGKVVKISKDTIFIDLGGKSEGMAGVGEFLDENGNLTLEVGKKVELRVASVKDGIYLSKGIKAQGADAIEILREAQQNLVPVEGRVAAVNKGGFEVDVSGNRAFCPVSQIGLQFCEKPEEHIGKRYQFRIMEIKEKGRNIVVSRRALLQEEQEKKLKETLARLKPGLDVEGKVTKLAEFGAFVDIGGIEGMVHISEISHGRISHPSEVLSPGQIVKARVLKIEPEKGGRQRIGLSIKALEPDAWEKGLGFQAGEVIPGKVSRLADFGAFVEVAPGVDGLVPVSEISFERVTHPSAVLHEGDKVDVLVLEINEQRRRISLSIREAAVRQRIGEGTDNARLEVGQILKGIVENSKPYGLFVRLPHLGIGIRGLLPLEELKDAEKKDVKKGFPKGKEIQVEIISIDEKGRIKLSQRVMKDREDREDYDKFAEKDKAGNLGTWGDVFKDLKL